MDGHRSSMTTSVYMYESDQMQSTEMRLQQLLITIDNKYEKKCIDIIIDFNNKLNIEKNKIENLIEKNKGYKELVDDEEYIYHIGSMAYSISQYFKMGKTAVQVRSSGYARFADVEIPSDVLNGSATVTFTGILTDYKGEAQFTLIDLSGVKKADGSPWYDANNKEIR